jgi:hypothetical protein
MTVLCTGLGDEVPFISILVLHGRFVYQTGDEVPFVGPPAYRTGFFK